MSSLASPAALRALLPPSAVAAVSRTDIPDAQLFPVEERLVARAVDRRRAEFATARECARIALGELGHAPCAIPAGPKGEPLWPAGVIGSITHCAGYRACAVAPDTELLALGIDAEPNQSISQGVLARIASQEEQASISILASTVPEVSWARLWFSTKEAVYKALFPLTRRRFGFDDVRLTADPDAEAISARLLTPLRLPGGTELYAVEARWALDGDVLIAAVALDGAC